MALDRDNALLDITGSFVHNQVKNQSWFKENANFVTSASGLLATLVAWAATQEFASDPRAQVVILMLGFLATVGGVKVTKNGWSKSQIAQIEGAKVAYVAEQPLRYDAEGSTLEAQIAQFNEGRAE